MESLGRGTSLYEGGDLSSPLSARVCKEYEKQQERGVKLQVLRVGQSLHHFQFDKDGDA